jgi:hypothetical protein
MNSISSDVTLKDVLTLHKKEILLDLFCHGIGTIESFDPAKQTCTASMKYKKTYMQPDATGKYVPQLVEYAPLIDCPVFVLQGGGGALTMPIKKGDTCIILFNDRDLDTWLSSGQITAPATGRLHAFSDAIMLVGIRSLKDALASYDPDYPELKYQGGSSVRVGAKIRIKNNSKNLYTILNNLISTLSSLQTIPAVVGTPLTLNPSIISQLNTIASDLGGLLE